MNLNVPQHKMTLQAAQKLVDSVGWTFATPPEKLVERVRHLPMAEIELITSAITTVCNAEIMRCQAIIDRD